MPKCVTEGKFTQMTVTGSSEVAHTHTHMYKYTTCIYRIHIVPFPASLFLVCVQYTHGSERATKKQERPRNTYHVNDIVRWM